MQSTGTTGQTEPLDAQWFLRLADIHEGVPARLAIRGYNEARKAFLAGSTENPVFRYTNTVDDAFAEKTAALRTLANDLDADERTPSAVKQLYQHKINEKQRLLRLVQLSHELTTDGHQSSASTAQEFRAITEAVFGPVDHNVFVHVCRVLQRKVTSIDVPKETETTKADLTKLLKEVSDRPTTVSDLSFKRVTDEGEPTTDQETVISQFTTALREAGLDNWRVQRGNRTRTGFVVKAGSNQIVVPNETSLKARRLQSELTPLRLRGIIAHELTHAIRHERGSQSALQLLAIGLPHYLSGEEGYATYRQQLITGADDYSGGPLYFAAGLAAGLDRGGEPRDFRGVYEVLYNYYSVLAAEQAFSPERVAFKVVTTLFKGTHGNHPGVFLTLQTCYREGNIRVHEHLRREPAWKNYGLLGKYDFTNPVHVEALHELGILPEVIE